MQTFNQIIDTLKRTIGATTDKAIAIELHIKPSSLAVMKYRGKVPYKAIMEYCRAHSIDADAVLLGETIEPMLPEGKVLVKLFGGLGEYGRWLDKQIPVK